MSHARIVLHDYHQRAREVADLWVPMALVRPSELAQVSGVHEHDLAARECPTWSLYRVAERICLTDTDEVEALKRDLPAPVFYVLREYYNLAGGIVAVDERRLREDTVLRYDRSLPWERGVLGEFFPNGVPLPPARRTRREREA